MKKLEPSTPRILELLFLFGTTGGAARGCTASAGGSAGALKFPAAGKSKGRHHPMDFFAFTLRAKNFFRGLQY